MGLRIAALQLAGFQPEAILFPLDGGGGLGGDVVDYAVDAAHFVDDLILEEEAQGLDDAEVHLLRKSADVVWLNVRV